MRAQRATDQREQSDRASTFAFFLATRPAMGRRSTSRYRV